ncbi:MAG: hypothetical protein GXO66_07490 [Euryarchaeota archaeon]|nr:hypothetical protein [Euryarchaeota archaeon]
MGSSGAGIVAISTVLVLVFLSAAQVAGGKVVSTEAPAGQPGYTDFTKLSILPKQKILEMKPGDVVEFQVKVRNREEASVVLEPRIVVMPFTESILEEEWISVTPARAEVEPGGTQSFKVVVSLPEDVETGYYSAQLAFTNETLGYLPGLPRAVNALNLNIRVWREPAVRITPTFIYDRVEAGGSYTYEVEVENTGEEEVTLKPRFGAEEYSRCRGFGCPGELKEEWVSITAPERVAPGGKATVVIRVDIPDAARGRYEGRIDLGVEDPARASYDRWWKVVTLSLEVWQQPASPYEKSFTVGEGVKAVRIEIGTVTRELGMPRYRKADAGEVGFLVTLVSPGGEESKPEPVRRSIKERVDLGTWYLPPWETASRGIYVVQSSEYRVEYTLRAPEPGVWKIRIMPVNTSNFEYSVVLE